MAMHRLFVKQSSIRYTTTKPAELSIGGQHG